MRLVCPICVIAHGAMPLIVEWLLVCPPGTTPFSISVGHLEEGPVSIPPRIG